MYYSDVCQVVWIFTQFFTEGVLNQYQHISCEILHRVTFNKTRGFELFSVLVYVCVCIYMQWQT